MNTLIKPAGNRAEEATARLLAIGGELREQSESGSRYFDLPGGCCVRVSDHAPNGKTADWINRREVLEVRIDKADWRDQLEAIVGPKPKPVYPKQGIFPMPAEDYHADKSAVSRTALSTFRDRRRLYFHEYIAGDAPAKKTTKPMEMGTLAHAGLLEPERFESLYVLYPTDILASNGAVSTTEAKAFRDDHRAASRIAVKQAELDAVRCMVESVKRKVGHWLKRDHCVEHAVYWKDEETDQLCRVRPDWLIEVPHGAVVIDLKGTGDVAAQAFTRRAKDNALWLQEAHYRGGVASALEVPRENVEFFFLVVEWEFPFATAMYYLPADKAAKAWRARCQLMRQLAACRESNDWSEPWERDIQPLDLHDSCFE